jgi:hypothetical protein
MLAGAFTALMCAGPPVTLADGCTDIYLFSLTFWRRQPGGQAPSRRFVASYCHMTVPRRRPVAGRPAAGAPREPLQNRLVARRPGRAAGRARCPAPGPTAALGRAASCGTHLIDGGCERRRAPRAAPPYADDSSLPSMGMAGRWCMCTRRGPPGAGVGRRAPRARRPAAEARFRARPARAPAAATGRTRRRRRRVAFTRGSRTSSRRPCTHLFLVGPRRRRRRGLPCHTHAAAGPVSPAFRDLENSTSGAQAPPLPPALRRR